MICYQIKEDDREALLESLYYDENANKFLSSNECYFSTAKALIAQGIHIDESKQSIYCTVWI